MEQQRVFRITVRGRFRDLSAAARAALVRSQPEHDLFLSAFTEEGTFTYDERIQFFNLRYEVRAEGDDASGTAGLTAEVEAETFLRTLGYGHHALKVDVVDVSAIRDDVSRRRPAASPPST